MATDKINEVAELRHLSADSTIGELLDNEAAKTVLLRHIATLVNAPQIEQARGQSLRGIQPYVRELLSDAVLTRIDAELASEPTALESPTGRRREASLDPAKALQLKTHRLWEGQAPMAGGDGQQDIPTLTVVEPDVFAFNGAAVVVAPGGGYMNLVTNHEGRIVADWFAAHGYTAFVLCYRLVPSGYLHPAQLFDAQRAMRWIRAHAPQYGIDVNRVGMAGFSAGGHLTAMASTLFDDGDAAAADPIERFGSRPDFAVLGYPAISISHTAIEGSAPSEETRREVRPIGNVRADTPPSFIFHTTADELVPPDNAISYYTALTAAKVPAELHIFQEGHHGLGLAMGHETVGAWPSLLNNWLRNRQLHKSAQ